MRARAIVLAGALALVCSACAQQRATPAPSAVKPVPLAVGGVTAADPPSPAILSQALALRTISAQQLRALDDGLRRCMARIAPDARDANASVRFRTCAFRHLAHSGASQRLNATLALALTRRLQDGSCRSSLFVLAAIARIVGTSSDAMLRDLNSRPRWSAAEGAGVRELRRLARATLVRLDPRAWHRHCAPAPVAQVRQQLIGQLAD